MDYATKLAEAFYDELEKIAASHRRWRILRERKGTKPMSVTTLLRKEKDGSLFKNSGNDHKIAQVQPFIGDKLTGAEALPKKRKGELPSRDELEATPKREDGRGNAATVPGSGNFLVAPDVGGRERAE